MTKLIMLVGLLAALGCSSGANSEWHEESFGGAGGAMQTEEPVEEEGQRYCHTLRDYQDAGGFWCETLDDGEFVETSDSSECRWCYLVICADDGIEWFPTECHGL